MNYEFIRGREKIKFHETKKNKQNKNKSLELDSV